MCVYDDVSQEGFYLCPFRTNNPQNYKQPYKLVFNNGELQSTKLNFSIIHMQDYSIEATNPITNQTSQRLDTVLTNMNNTYATKAEVETAIRGAESGLLKRSVVQALPVSEIDDNTIYMVPKTGSTGDVYDEYLYVNNVWEHIGSTDIDLTGYATTSYVNSALEGISLKRPLRIITVYTYAVVSQTYDSVNMATVYELMTNGSKLFPTQEDLDWCNNYLNYGFNEYPFMFQIKYADSSNYVNNQTLLLYPYTGLIRYANWDNVKNFRGMFQIVGNYGSGYIDISYSIWGNNSASFSGSSNYRLQWVSASSGYGPADISWHTYKWLTDRIAAVSSLPAQPSNDGDYLLKCSVSSGTAAYAWENVVVGGSY